MNERYGHHHRIPEHVAREYRSEVAFDDAMQDLERLRMKWWKRGMRRCE